MGIEEQINERRLDGGRIVADPMVSGCASGRLGSGRFRVDLPASGAQRLTSWLHRQSSPPHHNQKPRQIHIDPRYTPSASGNFSNSQKILVTKELSQIRNPDAPTLARNARLGLLVLISFATDRFDIDPGEMPSLSGAGIQKNGRTALTIP